MAGTGIPFYRQRKGLTQARVAEVLGVDPGHMSRLESGKAIPTEIEVDKLVELLGTPPNYLFSKHVLAEVAERAAQAPAAS